MSLPPKNLPRANWDMIPGRQTGYYHFAYVRYFKHVGILCPYPDWFQISVNADAKVWSHHDERYPPTEPVWIKLPRAKFEPRPVMADGTLVVSDRMLTIVESTRLEPKLKVFQCRLCRNGREIVSPVPYFGIYGEECRWNIRDLPQDIKSEMFSEAVKHYIFSYLHADQPEFGKYDLFVGPRLRLVYSEHLAEKMIAMEPALQFDPILTMD